VDPEVLLQTIRQLVSSIQLDSKREGLGLDGELAAAFQELDDHLSAGRVLPSDWRLAYHMNGRSDG